MVNFFASRPTTDCVIGISSPMVAALAPICADKFERAANTDTSLIAKLTAVDSWERDGHLIKAGWATFPGSAKPDSDVAKECLNLLKKSLKLK